MKAVKRTERGWADNDLKANEMHENAVKWVEEQFIADKLTYYYDE